MQTLLFLLLLLSPASPTQKHFVPVGLAPQFVYVDGVFSYTVNIYGQSVTVVNQNASVATITLDGEPYFGTHSLDTVNHLLYVSLWNQKSTTTVDVISTTTNQIVTRFTGGIEAAVSAYDPDNNVTYIAVNYGDTAFPNWQLVGFSPTGAVVSETPFATTDENYGLVWNPMNHFLYVANSGAKQVYAINPLDGEFYTFSSIGGSAFYSTLVACGSYVYAVDQTALKVNVFSSEQPPSLVGTITIAPLGMGNVYQLACNPATQTVYLSYRYMTGYLYAISGTAVSAVVPAGTNPWGGTYDAATGHLWFADYATNPAESTLLEFDATGKLIQSLAFRKSAGPQNPVYNATTGAIEVPIFGNGQSYLAVIGGQ